MEAVQALRQIFLFKNVSEPVLKLLAEVAEEVSFGPGGTIADESETARALLLIRSGTVRVSSERKPPVTFGAGEAIGQMALLDGGPIGMTVVALERVEAFAIRPETGS
jgi:CRP-like cAMP-binding protein